MLSEDTQVEMEEELQGYLKVKLLGSFLPRSSNPETLSPNQGEMGDLTSKTGHCQAQGHRGVTAGVGPQPLLVSFTDKHCRKPQGQKGGWTGCVTYK